MNKLGEVNVGKKSSINHKMVAWEVGGFPLLLTLNVH